MILFLYKIVRLFRHIKIKGKILALINVVWLINYVFLVLGILLSASSITKTMKHTGVVVILFYFK